MINNTFHTKDLMIAASIVAHDISLIDYKINGQYITFIFDKKDTCETIEKSWYASTLNVNATKYATAIKQLKNFVYNKLGD